MRRPVLLLAGAVVVVLVALAGRYGYHRDELYFLASGRHLAWGYVDQPPLTPALARLSEALFGDSLHGLRLFPALATGAIVVLAGATARALGGGRRAAVLAATAVAVGFFLGIGHLFATATFDNLFWASAVYVVIRALRDGDDPRLWLLAGAIAGVGLLNKHSVAFLLAGLFAGLLVARRDVLRTPWPWTAAAVALVVWAPNLVWHAQHDWPVVEMSRSLREEGIADGNTFLFVPAQLLLFNPVAAVMWIAGLAWLLRDRAGRAVRPVAIAYLVLVAVFVVTAGKPYYLAGLYPALFAAGAVWIERRWTVAGQRRYAAALLVVAALSAPLGLPLLPIDVVGDGPVAEVNPEHRESYGWPELVRAIDAVGGPDDVIVTRNYGEAGAVERFSDRDRPVHSGHNNYWLWGPPPDDATGVIVVGRISGDHFTGCELVAVNHNPEDVPNEEEGVPIRRCDGPRRPWSVEWDSMRAYRA